MTPNSEALCGATRMPSSKETITETSEPSRRSIVAAFLCTNIFALLPFFFVLAHHDLRGDSLITGFSQTLESGEMFIIVAVGSLSIFVDYVVLNKNRSNTQAVAVLIIIVVLISSIVYFGLSFVDESVSPEIIIQRSLLFYIALLVSGVSYYYTSQPIAKRSAK